MHIALVHIHETFILTSTALTILHRLSDQNMQKMQKNTRIPSLKSVLHVVTISKTIFESVLFPMRFRCRKWKLLFIAV